MSAPTNEMSRTEMVQSYLARNETLTVPSIIRRMRADHGVSVSPTTAYKAKKAFLRSRQAVSGTHAANGHAGTNGNGVAHAKGGVFPQLSAVGARVRSWLESHPDKAQLYPAELRRLIQDDLKMAVPYAAVANHRNAFLRRQAKLAAGSKASQQVPETAGAAPMTVFSQPPREMVSSSPVITLDAFRALCDAVRAAGGKQTAKMFIDLLPD